MCAAVAAAEITHFVQHLLFLASRLGFLKLATYHSHYYTATVDAPRCRSGNLGEYSLSITRSVVQRKNVTLTGAGEVERGEDGVRVSQ